MFKYEIYQFESVYCFVITRPVMTFFKMSAADKDSVCAVKEPVQDI
jgi:hypothetical protein